MLTPVLLLGLAAGIGASATERLAVTDTRTLLVAALEAADGSARGELQGPLADAITRRFAASTPIRIEVTTLRRYAQPGCARLNVRFEQAGVRLPDDPAPRAQTIDFGIDYCRDGQAPTRR
jgi:hypothetical protein